MILTKFLVIDTEHKTFLSGTSPVALGIIQINQGCAKINQCNSKQNSRRTKHLKHISERLMPLRSKNKNTLFSDKIGEFKKL